MTETKKKPKKAPPKAAAEAEPPDNLAIWRLLAHPPDDALKRIGGGRLKGKHDINPQWRIEVMTQVFGPIGKGWRFEVTRREPYRLDATGEVALFVEVALWVRYPGDEEWTGPLHGSGGSMLVSSEKGALYLNDEAEKMAITDALSAAMKMLGVAADVYRGVYDTKYSGHTPAAPAPGRPKPAARREAEPVEPCPKCGKATSVIRRKPEWGGGFTCWTKRDGCGAVWGREDEPRNGGNGGNGDEAGTEDGEQDSLLDRALGAIVAAQTLERLDEILIGAKRVLSADNYRRVEKAASDRAEVLENLPQQEEVDG